MDPAVAWSGLLCRAAWTRSPSNHVRAALRQEFPQQGPVAAALVPAVAAQRQVGAMRQRGEYVQFAAPVGCAHLPAKFPAERGPRPLVRRSVPSRGPSPGFRGAPSCTTKMDPPHTPVCHAAYRTPATRGCPLGPALPVHANPELHDALFQHRAGGLRGLGLRELR